MRRSAKRSSPPTREPIPPERCPPVTGGSAHVPFFMPRSWHAAIPSRVRAGARRPSRRAIAAVAYHLRRLTGGDEVADREPGVLVGWRRRAEVIRLAVTGGV